MMISALLLCFASVAQSQEPPDGKAQVDVAAVLRLGDHVQHVDGIQAGPDDAFTQAMELPADDRDKWFICILTIANCPACDTLKATWSATPELVALGDSSAPANSWSHFSTWNMGDASQAAKFKHVRTSSYPTIIVQPPRSGAYGPPSDIVYQHAGTMAGSELARQIRESIKLRVAMYPGTPIRQAGPVDLPRVEQTKPVSGSNRFPPLPFDPDGATSILPLFPGDQTPEVPPRSLINRATGYTVQGILGGLFSGLDDFTNGWGMEIVVAAGALLLARFLGYTPADAKALLTKVLDAVRKKPDPVVVTTQPATRGGVFAAPESVPAPEGVVCNPMTPEAERRIADMVAEQLRK